MRLTEKLALLKTKRGLTVCLLFAVAITFGIIGAALLQASHAATTATSLEAESGTIVAPAGSVTDTTASGGKAVKFAPASTGGTHISPNHAREVGIIGDSLTADMSFYNLIKPALQNLGWQANEIQVDGQWGRGITNPSVCGVTGTASPYTPAVISSWRAAKFDPRVWLIALGTNNPDDGDVCWRKAIQSVVDQIKSGPETDYKIYWLGTGYASTGDNSRYNSAAYQTSLNASAAANTNMTAVDYNAYLAPLRSDSRWSSWWDGGIHNTQAGYTQVRLPEYLNILRPEKP